MRGIPTRGISEDSPFRNTVWVVGVGGFPASLGVGVGYHHPPTHWREPVGARQWSNPAAAATHWVVLRPAIAPSAVLAFFTTQDQYEPICGGPRCSCHWVDSRGTRASECPFPPPWLGVIPCMPSPPFCLPVRVLIPRGAWSRWFGELLGPTAVLPYIPLPSLLGG